LWIRDLDSVEARPLEGTEGAWFPFWSPSNDAIAFFAGGKLKRVPVNGGVPIVLADAVEPRGGSWSKEGVIVFSPGGGNTGLMRVPAAGGEATPATTIHPELGEIGHRWPSFLPDGKHLLYFSFGAGRYKRAVYATTLGSKDAAFIAASDSYAQYAGNSQVAFMRKGSLYSQRIDERTLRPEGDPVLIQRQVGFASVIYFGAFSASHTNVIAWAPWMNPNRRLTWLDRSGAIAGTVFEPADWGTASLALLGDRAVLTRSDPDTANLDLWLVDLTRGVGSHLTTDEADDNHPVWLPDGRTVIFTSTRNGRTEIFRKTLGDQREQLLYSDEHSLRPTGVSPDGRYVVFYERTPSAASDIWLLPVAPPGPAVRFLAGRAGEWGGVVSPDGQWIAYTSDESGRDEIYVQPFPAGGDRTRVSVNGGATPKWAVNGKELFFMTENAEIASVSVKAGGPRFACSVPAVLFHVPGLVATHPAFQHDFGVAADGRFLITLPAGGPPPATIDVAVNRPPR
jgi:eukaryotic-like serine/threonine-protein kinase